MQGLILNNRFDIGTKRRNGRENIGNYAERDTCNIWDSRRLAWEYGSLRSQNLVDHEFVKEIHWW